MKSVLIETKFLCDCGSFSADLDNTSSYSLIQCPHCLTIYKVYDITKVINITKYNQFKKRFIINSIKIVCSAIVLYLFLVNADCITFFNLDKNAKYFALSLIISFLLLYIFEGSYKNE